MLQTSKNRNSYTSPKVPIKKRKMSTPQSNNNNSKKQNKKSNQPNKPSKRTPVVKFVRTEIKPAKVKKLSFLDKLNTPFLLQLLIV